MSTALAIAGTSAVLQSLLNTALNNTSGPSTSIGGVTVSAVAPDLVQSGQATSPKLQVNLFLHQVTPNAAWRNVELPSLAADGSTRLRNTPLALDLHYLLTAYGTQDFEAEALLGIAVQLLHETPVLARGDIRTILQPPSSPPPGPPKAGNASLNTTGLADQLELLKITPSILGREEMAWLWTALKADYRPTFPFQVTVVLIQAQNPGVSALPVLTRSVAAQASLLSSVPTLTSVTPPGGQPAASPGDLVTVAGLNLLGASNVLLVNAQRGFSQTVAATSVGINSLQFTIPNPQPPPSPPTDFPAGVYLLSVQIGPGPGAAVTNSLPFALAPTITAGPGSPVTPVNGAATLNITCAPFLRPQQDASLLIGGQSAPVTAIPAATNTLSFQFTGLQPTAGPVPVRLRVDGVDSPIINMAATTPVFIGTTVQVT